MEQNCYCNTSEAEKDPFMIPCQECKKLFHKGCLMTGRPSILEGDVFFNLICGHCSPNGEESVTRMKLQWLQIVSLSLYNLQLMSSGKYGYFRWKEQVCMHIDQHWNLLLGNKKKSSLWHGTVAGTLSSYPGVFQSGTKELGESGWWRLAENKPATLLSLTDPSSAPRYARKTETIVQPTTMTEGLRSRTRSRPSSIQAAMELKAKRATTQESKEIRKLKLSPEMNQLKSAQETSTTDTSRESSPVLKQSDMKITIKLSPAVTISSSSEEQLTTMAETPTTSRGSSRQARSTGKAAKRKAKQSAVNVISLDPDEEVATSSDATIISDSEPMALTRKISSEEPIVIDSDSQLSRSSSLRSESLIPTEPIPSVVGTSSLFDDHGNEDEDLSDLEVDPCSITPPDSPAQGHILSSVNGSLPVKDIISAIPDRSNASPEPEPECEAVMYAQKVPTQRETMTSRAIQSLTIPEPKAQNKKSGDQKPEDERTEAKKTDSKIKPKKKQEKEEENVESSGSEDGASGDEGESRRRKNRKSKGEALDLDEPPAKIQPLSIHEERQLLRRLQSYGTALSSNPTANRLKRKLIVRQLKRERGLQVFDLDIEVSHLLQTRGLIAAREDTKKQEEDMNDMGLPTMRYSDADYRVLDRFQVSSFSKWGQYYQPKTFMNRLVGTEDDQLTSIRSPYTARLLKPFIRRDYETIPKKMKLLQEIQAYPHRNDPTWKPPPRPPIDYCYVRPQHIPSVNAFCREFFWPGIDLSECLQYPDFSCVVLYRKFVIGFAFLVPDVKYNEAYISFIFTHPEWRGAGIATFMLYHLIQTCMGKDITLHVSASNPAMLLYQKFGFKPEEFILDFYDKYFPVDSTECRHAFFLRLRR